MTCGVFYMLPDTTLPPWMMGRNTVQLKCDSCCRHRVSFGRTGPACVAYLLLQRVFDYLVHTGCFFCTAATTAGTGRRGTGWQQWHSWIMFGRGQYTAVLTSVLRQPRTAPCRLWMHTRHAPPSAHSLAWLLVCTTMCCSQGQDTPDTSDPVLPPHPS